MFINSCSPAPEYNGYRILHTYADDIREWFGCFFFFLRGVDLIESVVNNKNALMHWACICGESTFAAGKRTKIEL